MIYAGLIIFTVIIVYAIYRAGTKSGRTFEDNKVMEQSLDDIHTVHLARERLKRDPDAAAKLREKYTRGE